MLVALYGEVGRSEGGFRWRKGTVTRSPLLHHVYADPHRAIRQGLNYYRYSGVRSPWAIRSLTPELTELQSSALGWQAGFIWCFWTARGVDLGEHWSAMVIAAGSQ